MAPDTLYPLLFLVFLCGLIVGSAVTVVLLRRRTPQEEPESTFVDSPDGIRSRLAFRAHMPDPGVRYGKPELIAYRPQEYEAPLQCVETGHPLEPDAMFFRIPLINEPDACLAVCVEHGILNVH